MTELPDEDVLTSKIIAGSTLFIVSILFGIAPFKLAQIFKWTEPIDPNNKDNKKSKIVSILLCFGGGVLLATTFLHLLPEINEEIHELQKKGEIPHLEHLSCIGEVLMMCGFFLIYLIEEIVHYYLHRYQESLRKSQASVATMKPDEESIAEVFMRGISARNSVQYRETESNGCIQMTSRRESVIIDENGDTKTLSIDVKGHQKASDTEKNHMKEMSHNNNYHNHNTHAHSHTAALPIHNSSDEDMLVSSLRGLLIVLALSIHELFEGFAVGLQKSSYGVYYMFAAVCAHKFVISFCIGVELMVQKTKIWLALIYVFVYSIVSALGILVGAILTTGSYSETLQVPNVILQGFATGTLLYVIFFEVLSKDHRSGIITYLSIFCGFIIMFGLQYIAAVTESQRHSVIEITNTTSNFIPV